MPVSNRHQTRRHGDLKIVGVDDPGIPGRIPWFRQSSTMKVGYHRTIPSPCPSTHTVLSPPPYKTITCYTFCSPWWYFRTSSSPPDQYLGIRTFLSPGTQTHLQPERFVHKAHPRHPQTHVSAPHHRFLQLDLACTTGSDAHQATGRALRL